jgi:hypothetical protein
MINKQNKDNLRQTLANSIYKLITDNDCIHSNTDYDWKDASEVYLQLETPKDCAYLLETVLQWCDVSEETKMYFNMAMEILHYMEWYQD